MSEERSMHPKGTSGGTPAKWETIMLKQQRNYFFRLLTVICLIVALGQSVVNPAVAGQELDKEQIKAIVKEVIRENPKLIIDSVNQYMAEQKKKEADQAFDRSFKSRLTDTTTEENPQKGPADAPITIIEYTDFQCPYCARGAKTLDQVQKMYPEKVRVVFKNLPLEMHKQAIPAAKAALAAKNQGRFWDYYDLLFKNSKTLNEGIYNRLAVDLSLNVDQFTLDMNSESIAALIQNDLEQAKKLGFKSTPQFLINGVRVKGAQPPEYFAKVIDRLLGEAKK